MTKILYLGHVISAHGVLVHKEKIHAILDWPPPKTLTSGCVDFMDCKLIKDTLLRVSYSWVHPLKIS